MKVVNFIKDFFSKNAGWKIASLVIAVILWLVVMNTLNPAETKSFYVNVKLINEQYLAESGYAILNTSELENTRVEVKVKGTRPALDELTKEKENGAISADLDFQTTNISNIVDTPQSLALNLEPKINNIYLYQYEIVSFSPSYVNVLFDSVKEKDLELNTSFTGKLEDGYAATVEKLSSEAVTVYGPASEFDKVDRVNAVIDLNDKTGDFQAELKPIVYNTSGDAMSNFIVSPDYITAQVSVQYTRNLEILKPETTGTINSELTLKNIDWTPKVLELTGDKAVLDALRPIKLPSIELDKLAGSDIRTYEITQFINDNRISTKSNAPRVITVTIEVSGKDGKNITFNADEINVTGLGEGLKAQLPSQVVFTVFGEPSALANVTNASFSPSVDLTGISEGAKEVVLNVNLPDGVQVRGETRIYVYVTKEDKKDTETTVTVVETTGETTAATTTTEAPVSHIEEPDDKEDETEEIIEEPVVDDEKEDSEA